MDRPLRAFQPAALPLEGRILLARVHVPLPPPVVATATAAPIAAASFGLGGVLGHSEFRGDHAAGRSARRRSDRMVAAAIYSRPVAGSSDDRPVIAGRGRELASGEPDGHL